MSCCSIFFLLSALQIFTHARLSLVHGFIFLLCQTKGKATLSFTWTMSLVSPMDDVVFGHSHDFSCRWACTALIGHRSRFCPLIGRLQILFGIVYCLLLYILEYLLCGRNEMRQHWADAPPCVTPHTIPSIGKRQETGYMNDSVA